MTATLLLSATMARGAGPTCDPAAIAAGLVINELLVDPEGIDPGLQWVEIYNETGLDLDASGWRIQAGSTTYNSGSELPPGTFLIDGEFVVIAQSALPFADLVLPGFIAGAGAADADAVRIVDCFGAAVDTVVYGPANPDGWLDDSGGVAVSFATAAASGQSLARRSDALDTDQSGADFALVTAPTPGSTNSLPPDHCGGPGSGLLVNEVHDDGLAWVELLHVGAAPVLLSGWSLAVGTTSMQPVYTFGDGQVISPGGRFVVGEAPEAVYPADLALLGVGAVRLVDCGGFGADTVVLGPDNPMGFVDDGGTAAVSLAPALAAGSSLSRYPDGSDSDDAGVDFASLAATPSTENGTAPPTTTKGTPSETGDTAGPTDTGTTSETGTSTTDGPTSADTGLAADDPKTCGCRSAAGSGWLLGLIAALTGRRSRSRR